MQDTKRWNVVVNKSVYQHLYTKKLPNSWLETQLHYTHVVERLDKYVVHSAAEHRFRCKKNRSAVAKRCYIKTVKKWGGSLRNLQGIYIPVRSAGRFVP